MDFHSNGQGYFVFYVLIFHFEYLYRVLDLKLGGGVRIGKVAIGCKSFVCRGLKRFFTKKELKTNLLFLMWLICAIFT